MYVNTQKEKFICHRCGWGGSVDKLLNNTGAKTVVSIKNWEQKLAELLNPSKISAEDKSVVGKLVLPEDYVPCMDNTEAMRYLLSRGFTRDEVYRRKVGFGSVKFKGMIIFPEYSKKGDLLYWTSKPYGQYKKIKHAKNCIGAKHGYLYWLANVPDARYVVVTESVFDSIVFGDHGIGILGSRLTHEQLDALCAGNFSRYYLALDGDAKRDKQLLIANALWQRGKDVRLVHLPDNEDPSSLGKQQALLYLKKATKYHPDIRYAVAMDPRGGIIQKTTINS
jgi:DNA primase